MVRFGITAKSLTAFPENRGYREDWHLWLWRSIQIRGTTSLHLALAIHNHHFAFFALFGLFLCCYLGFLVLLFLILAASDTMDRATRTPASQVWRIGSPETLHDLVSSRRLRSDCHCNWCRKNRLDRDITDLDSHPESKVPQIHGFKSSHGGSDLGKD